MISRIITPLCEKTRSTSTNDVTVKSLLPALALQFEASKWQGQGHKCQDQGQGQCHDYQDQGPHCQVYSHCSVQCWQLTEFDFAVNQLLFFS